MKKYFLIVIALFALIPMTLFGFASCAKSDKTIRLIEVTHSVFYAPLYIALDGGYFEDEGLDVKLTNGGGSDKCMTALLSKQSDIGLLGVEACI